MPYIKLGRRVGRAPHKNRNLLEHTHTHTYRSFHVQPFRSTTSGPTKGLFRFLCVCEGLWGSVCAGVCGCVYVCVCVGDAQGSPQPLQYSSQKTLRHENHQRHTHALKHTGAATYTRGRSPPFPPLSSPFTLSWSPHTGPSTGPAVHQGRIPSCTVRTGAHNLHCHPQLLLPTNRTLTHLRHSCEMGGAYNFGLCS